MAAGVANLRYAQRTRGRKIAVLAKTLACTANDQPILTGRRVLEKELERHQKKLNGPENTAKHIEAKQNWINRETKRVEAEIEKVAEMWESIRVRKRNSFAGGEESMDPNRSHVLSPEKVWNVELQELYLRRASASKRMAGAKRDAMTEDIATWIVEADRNVGTVKRCDRPCDSESVELERGWTVGGSNGDFLVANFDGHRMGCFVVATVFQKNGWSECWCTRAIHAERTGGLRWSGQAEAVGRASRSTAVELDGQLTVISAHLPHKGNRLEISRRF